jgi:hypothetical protein
MAQGLGFYPLLFEKGIKAARDYIPIVIHLSRLIVPASRGIKTDRLMSPFQSRCY